VRKGLGRRHSISGIEESAVLCGVVGIIRMNGSSRPKMKEVNGVPNDADEEGGEYVVVSCIRMGGLKGIGRG